MPVTRGNWGITKIRSKETPHHKKRGTDRISSHLLSPRSHRLPRQSYPNSAKAVGWNGNNMADENEKHFPNVSSNHETLWKEKYFTLLKHCRQIEQVMYYLENCTENCSLSPNDIVRVKHTRKGSCCVSLLTIFC